MPTRDPQVDRRVRITLPDDTTATGVVVYDFGDLIGDHVPQVVVTADHTVLLRRYAITLDDGGLHFTDDIEIIDTDAELTEKAGAGQSGSERSCE